MSPDFRAREYLRRATAEQHAFLDAAASRTQLGTSAGYAQFLSQQATALVPLERSLESAGIEHLLPDWADRRRTEALLADLAELGAATEYRDAPSFSGDAGLLGATYVLEGSRLGARIVLQLVGPHSATRFLRHGEDRQLWQSFLGVLETNADVQANPQRAANAARNVFSLFIDAMTSNEMAAA